MAGFAQSTVTWTGGTGTNWSNGANWLGGTQPADGANVAFPDTLPHYQVTLDLSPSVASLTFTESLHYFDSPDVATLTIGPGGLTASTAHAYVFSPISIVLGAPQSWNLNSYSLLHLPASISGTPSNALAVTVDGNSRLTLLGDNNFTGSVTLTGAGILSLGGNTALGSATVTVSGGGVIESYFADVTVPNAVSITGTTLQLGTAAGSVTLSGPLTLSSSPTFTVTGIHPAYFTGTLGETGGAQNITVSSYALPADHSIVGPLVLQGPSGYTGTTTLVDNARLILGTASALPVTNASIRTDPWLNSAYNVGNFAYGTYAGLGAAGVPAGTFVGKFNGSNYSGAVGFDNGITITDAIDLTGFNQFARLASLSTATISGPITPQGSTYNFGGGGGALTVATNLVDDGPNERSVRVVSTNDQPLSLILSGTNTFSGSATVGNSVLRFATAAALPANRYFIIPLDQMGWHPHIVDKAYIGFDYNQDLSVLVERVSVPANGVIVLGYDSPGSPRTISDAIDLSVFSTIAPYLGTSTSLTLTGSITPDLMSSGWRFAAVKGGDLTVASGLSGARSVIIGVAQGEGYDVFARGLEDTPSTVRLTGGNAYTGGTTLQSGRLVLGNATALGTGALDVTGEAMLTTAAGGFTVANNISTNYGLDLNTPVSLTLSGALSGYGSIRKTGEGTLRLEGSSPGYSGDFTVAQGTLEIAHNEAVRSAQFWIDDGTVSLVAPAPQIDRLYGWGTLNLNSNALRINWGGEFSGSIVGAGNVTLENRSLKLSGASTYTGGTNIMRTDAWMYGVLIADNGAALGTGPVNLSGGVLYTNKDVALANTLNFTGGTLGGVGTFSSPGDVTIGDARMLSPGFAAHFAGREGAPVGSLSFGGNLVLASGGTYSWEIADALGAPGTGWDYLLVTGSIIGTATVEAPFILSIAPADSGYESSYYQLDNFDNSQTYSWRIASATGEVTGFDLGKVSLDSSQFSAHYPLGTGQFFLTASGNELLLNFSPVPEPSTCALLALGLGLIGLTAWRKRRTS